ncbi:MAG: hypothetical protein PHY30_01455 [Candidatus Pacebacteria bacterium]|nr:hypothetical protein [Candidatus Paceibacterota bacterium]
MFNNTLILFAVIAIINSLQVPQTANYESDCINSSFKWIENYNECEGVKRDWCKERSGVFDECASACRHNPKSEMCITLCVPVCKLK